MLCGSSPWTSRWWRAWLRIWSCWFRSKLPQHPQCCQRRAWWPQQWPGSMVSLSSFSVASFSATLFSAVATHQPPPSPSLPSFRPLHTHELGHWFSTCPWSSSVPLMSLCQARACEDEPPLTDSRVVPGRGSRRTSRKRMRLERVRGLSAVVSESGEGTWRRRALCRQGGAGIEPGGRTNGVRGL